MQAQTQSNDLAQRMARAIVFALDRQIRDLETKTHDGRNGGAWINFRNNRVGRALVIHVQPYSYRSRKRREN
jgi:hypothetical protein